MLLYRWIETLLLSRTMTPSDLDARLRCEARDRLELESGSHATVRGRLMSVLHETIQRPATRRVPAAAFAGLAGAAVLVAAISAQWIMMPNRETPGLPGAALVAKTPSMASSTLR